MADVHTEPLSSTCPRLAYAFVGEVGGYHNVSLLATADEFDALRGQFKVDHADDYAPDDAYSALPFRFAEKQIGDYAGPHSRGSVGLALVACETRIEKAQFNPPRR